MALKSAYERFNAIMNGEDIDADVPSIDVEINVIQKEIEAEETTEEMNDAESDASDIAETMDQAEESIEEAEMLVKILRTDGINPVALKIISTNKLYTDIWRIGMPSVESLDVTGTNRRQAEAIASTLESKIRVATEGVKELWQKFIEFLKRIFNVGSARVDDKLKKVKSLKEKLDKIGNYSIDKDKLKEKTVDTYKTEDADELVKAADNLYSKVTGNISSSDIESLEKEIKDLDEKFNKTSANRKLTGDELLDFANKIDISKTENNIKAVKNKLESTIESLDDYIKNDKLASEDIKKNVSKVRSIVNKAMTMILRVFNNLLAMNIKIISTVNSCEKNQ